MTRLLAALLILCALAACTLSQPATRTPAPVPTPTLTPTLTPTRAPTVTSPPPAVTITPTMKTPHGTAKLNIVFAGNKGNMVWVRCFTKYNQFVAGESRVDWIHDYTGYQKCMQQNGVTPPPDGYGVLVTWPE